MAFAACFSLLGISCVLASLVLACATPFAAFAVVAAAMLPMPSALAVVGGAGLINQAIGFGLLGYPADFNTIAWGGVILASAFAATAAASTVLRKAHGNRLISVAMAFLAAFAAYELLLLAATPILGGHEAMVPAIVAWVAGLNAAWLLGLLAAVGILQMLVPAAVPNSPASR
jgi:hypothetical protein